MKAKFTAYLMLVQVIFLVRSYAQNINTIVGGLGDNGAATAAELYNPYNAAVDRSGNIFIADDGNRIVRKVDVSGKITTIAGIAGADGTTSDGDGGLAIHARIGIPRGVAVDTFGNVYFSDWFGGLIRKVNASGIISTYAGGGGLLGDGIDATSTDLLAPWGICMDIFGNLYIAESGRNKIKKVDPSGIITTVAGSGAAGFDGDTGPATMAKLNTPNGVCVDKYGNIFISDNVNNRVRKVDAAGTITTYAGNGMIGYTGDGASATLAKFNVVSDVAVDTSGNLYIADNNNNEIRKVNTSGIISTVAGSFIGGGFSGDGGLADTARLNLPTGIATDRSGNFYITDRTNNRIRKVNAAGVITTIAGSKFYNCEGFAGDGGPVGSALLDNPMGLAYDTAYNLYIADYNNYVVRKVSASGIISTFAGNGTPDNQGDGGMATDASLASPTSIATDRKGNVYICAGSIVRRVNSAGVISTYAADINAGVGIATDKNGNLFISDNNNRIRKVDTNGIISTIAGTGTSGYFGDGGPAGIARLSQPFGIATDDSGNVLFADYNNKRVRKIDLSGIISTVAGGGTGGMGGLATLADINHPVGVAVDRSGNIYIANDNKLVYKVDHSGIISLYAGNGSGFYGDGGPAVFAKLDNDMSAFNGSGLVVDTSGDLLIPDTRNNRVREVYNASIVVSFPSPVCSSTPLTFTAIAAYAPVYIPYYRWIKNGVGVGTNSNVYTEAAPVDGDKIFCYITNGPAGPGIATSNEITLAVTTSVAPSVSISVPSLSLCSGVAALCRALSVNGGTNPTYEWYKNDTLVFTGDSLIFTPAGSDRVYCKLTSNAVCALPDTALSPLITFTVTPLSTPSVSFSISPNDTVCSGVSVTCSAASLFGGSSPVYYWYKNAALVSTGADPYEFIPANGDMVYCSLRSDYACLLTDTATSDSSLFVVKPSVAPAVSISVDPGTKICNGATAQCIASGVNEGTSPIYEWYLNNSPVSSGSEYDFTPAGGDQLYCQLTSNTECASPATANSSTSYFTIDSLSAVTISCDPDQPDFRGTTVTFTAIVSGNGGPYAYKWLMNGVQIPGVNASSFSTNKFSIWDSVKCIVTDLACSDEVVSNTLLINTYHDLKLYPDPNDGDFVINGNDYNANGDNVNIRVYNSNGNLVYETHKAFDAITFYTEIRLKNVLPPGVYMLRLGYSLKNLSFIFAVKH